jgi:hypothetical protein
MPFAPVNISDGQVSGIDDLGPASSSVINWELDDANINMPRPALSDYDIDDLTSDITGLEKWGAYVVATDTDLNLWAVPDVTTDSVVALSAAAASRLDLESTLRPVFAAGEDHVYVAAGGQLHRWGPTLALSERVSNSPRCTHVAAIGNYLVTNDRDNPDQVNHSSIGEGTWTTWPSDNYTTADARPDAVVGVYENLNELFIFGESTLQVYALGNDPTLPFDKTSTINTGLGAPYCVVRMDETFAFLDNHRRIVIGDGRSQQVISDAIARDLRSLDTISDSWGYREEIGQNSKLVFRFPTEGRTFVYDIRGKRWTERNKYTAPSQGDFGVSAYCYRPSDNSHIVGTSAGLNKLVTDSRQDNGGALVCERTTGWSDYGSQNRKRSVRVRVTMKRGTGTINVTPGALEVRVQSDDGPWSEWKQISVGEPSDYSNVKDLFFGGIFHRRRFGLRYSTSESFSLVSVQDEIMELVS